MKTIDLKNIIEKQDLDRKDLEKKLFPKVKYPNLALNRILSGDAFLDTNQVSILSQITGMPIELLYSGGEWKKEGSEDLLKFTAGEFSAELNTKTWVTKIYHNDSIFHEEVIANGAIPLSEYLQSLTDLILKHKKQ